MPFQVLYKLFMGRFILSLVCLLTSLILHAQVELKLSRTIYDADQEVFHAHENALALSVPYLPVEKLRLQMETFLGKKLEHFTEWNPRGEAHVTVVTPPEFEVLKSKLTMKEITKIADQYDIQASRINLLGVGSGKLKINENVEETYFLIVDSYDLRNIRQQIFYEFVRRGGGRALFDPTWFFPHVTIGYTKRDLHEVDGVIKNLKHSFDERFKLSLTP